jgi:hypothetical protein
MARGVLSSASLQSSLVFPTLAVVKTLSSRTQPVRALSTPSVMKSDAEPGPPAATTTSATPAIAAPARHRIFMTKRIICSAHNEDKPRPQEDAVSQCEITA